jgi:hypothetical protein
MGGISIVMRTCRAGILQAIGIPRSARNVQVAPPRLGGDLLSLVAIRRAVSQW